VARHLLTRKCLGRLIPDPLLLRKSGSVGNRNRTFGYVASNSDHWTIEAVYFLLHNIYKSSSYLTENTTHLHFFFLDPIYLQSVTIHSANGGKGEGWHGIFSASLIKKFAALEPQFEIF
jgi:hypothetical protein